MSIKADFRHIPDLPLSFVLGVVGGAACGTLIFSFNSVMGRSGTTGSEFLGAWDWGVLGLGIIYGSFFGILMMPLGYILFIRSIGLRKALLPAFIGTILGGLLGALNSPLRALCYGCLGFFSALVMLRVGYYLKDRSIVSKQP